MIGDVLRFPRLKRRNHVVVCRNNMDFNVPIIFKRLKQIGYPLSDLALELLPEAEMATLVLVRETTEPEYFYRMAQIRILSRTGIENTFSAVLLTCPQMVWHTALLLFSALPPN